MTKSGNSSKSGKGTHFSDARKSAYYVPPKPLAEIWVLTFARVWSVRHALRGEVHDPLASDRLEYHAVLTSVLPGGESVGELNAASRVDTKALLGAIFMVASLLVWPSLGMKKESPLS